MLGKGTPCLKLFFTCLEVLKKFEWDNLGIRIVDALTILDLQMRVLQSDSGKTYKERLRNCRESESRLEDEYKENKGNL